MAPSGQDGEKAGRYTLVKRMAAGGMADLFLAQQWGPRGYERTVVVKRLHDEVVEQGDAVSLLLEEARIAACLDHDNIVDLLEVGEQDGVPFLAMEFVFGRDLGRVRDRCMELGVPIPPEHIRTIMREVLKALDYAHHRAHYDGRPLRVIHRDVSPQNILVGFDGSVKLLDFGLAKATIQLSQTHAGILKGKYAYMAPEQVSLRAVDHRVDIFSSGVVLWELITGQRLFWRDAELDMVHAVRACRVPWPSRADGSIPLPLAMGAYRALRRHPALRFRSGAAMARAIGRGDPRSDVAAKDALAEWMAALFSEQLEQRRHALVRARADASRFREIQDAGFELLDEITDPDLRINPEAFLKAIQSQRDPPARPRGLASGRFFFAVLALVILLGFAVGLGLGRFAQPVVPEGVGYVSVEVAQPDAVVEVGGQTLGRGGQKNIMVWPGRHRVVVRWGTTERKYEIDVAPGERRTLRLDLSRAAPDEIE